MPSENIGRERRLANPIYIIEHLFFFLENVGTRLIMDYRVSAWLGMELLNLIDSVHRICGDGHNPRTRR